MTAEERVARQRLMLSLGLLGRAVEAATGGHLDDAYDFTNDAAEEARLAAIAIDEARKVRVA